MNNQDALNELENPSIGATLDEQLAEAKAAVQAAQEANKAAQAALKKEKSEEAAQAATDAANALAQATEKLKALQQEKAAAKAKAKPKSKSGLSVVEVDGEFKEFTIPTFSLNGKIYTHEEAANNPETISKLKEVGFGGWKSIE